MNLQKTKHILSKHHHTNWRYIDITPIELGENQPDGTQTNHPPKSELNLSFKDVQIEYPWEPKWDFFPSKLGHKSLGAKSALHGDPTHVTSPSLQINPLYSKNNKAQENQPHVGGPFKVCRAFKVEIVGFSPSTHMVDFGFEVAHLVPSTIHGHLWWPWFQSPLL